jgi:hypothetical protein
VLLCIEDTAGFQRCSDPTSAPSRGRPLPVRLYSLNFPTQLLGVGCERLREWSRSRRARETRPSTIVATPSKEMAINSAQLSLQVLNELASKLPDRYRWRFRTEEAFSAEFQELAESQSTTKDFGPLNRLYWEDALKNCEAYSIMMTWRVIELARSCIWALARRDLICGALTARAALESTAQYLDCSRTVSATLEQVPVDVDIRRNAIVSEDLEKFLLRTVFASRRPGDDEIYKPTNILTIVSRIARALGRRTS